MQVWKIEPSGRRTIAVPRVHTHHLYIDANDNLYGQESVYSGEATNTWSHSVWRLTKNGKLEMVIPMKDGFYIENFSFAQDNAGNMFWVKHAGNLTSFMKTTPSGNTSLIANGYFDRVQWIHVIRDRIYYVSNDTIFVLDQRGKIQPYVTRFTGNGHNSLFNIWSDNAGDLYVANSDQKKIQKISGRTVTTVYRSKDGWFPTSGCFDKNGKLHVLEWNTKNEVRVVNL